MFESKVAVNPLLTSRMLQDHVPFPEMLQFLLNSKLVALMLPEFVIAGPLILNVPAVLAVEIVPLFVTDAFAVMK
jgi:hypothetical protein